MNDGKRAAGLAPHLRRLAKDVAYTHAHAQVMLAAADDLDLLRRDNEILREADIRPQDLERRRAERAEARVAELEAEVEQVRQEKIVQRRRAVLAEQEVNRLKEEILQRDSAELSARYAERNARPLIGESVLARHKALRKERRDLLELVNHLLCRYEAEPLFGVREFAAELRKHA